MKAIVIIHPGAHEVLQFLKDCKKAALANPIESLKTG
jgi:hypothetical protein